MKIGSFCSGYGGLEIAVEAITGGHTAWQSETDPHAARVLAHRWPDVPNHGDLTTFNWSLAESVDAVCAGYPCQPFSTAGRRGGENDARHIWPHILRAVRILGPRLVLLENVAGHLSLGFGRVLGDLAEAGYDARWTCLRAADVGAPHRRERLFVIAYPTDGEPSVPQSDDSVRGERSSQRRRELQPAGAGTGGRTARRDRPAGNAGVGSTARSDPTSPADSGSTGGAPADAFGGAAQLRRGPRQMARSASHLESERHQRQRSGHPAGGCGQAAADAESAERRGPGGSCLGRAQTRATEPGERDGSSAAFGVYQPAVDRWVAILGRPAPPGLHDGRLNERFVEWLMGLPEGWVTDLVPRRHALRILGNGVVPQQAEAAYRSLLSTELEVAS